MKTVSDLADVPADSVARRQGDGTYTVEFYDPPQNRPVAGRPTPQRVPTYDRIASVGHVDVLDFGEGNEWSGWRYWMAFTPYPDPTGGRARDRENPSIVVSHDGRSWRDPVGIVNPILTLAAIEADGYEHNSDPELVYDPVADRLVCYYRPVQTSGSRLETIERMDSADGVNWGNRTQLLHRVLSSGDSVSEMLSPAVVREDDGTWSMWTVQRDADVADSIERRTSDDGLDWTTDPVQTCAFPAGVAAPWHLDVQRVGSTYHMLLNTRTTSGDVFRLAYLTSTDGLTWSGSGDELPLTGGSLDENGYYRSAFVVNGDGTLDIWANAMDGSSSSPYSAWWTVLLREGVAPW